MIRIAVCDDEAWMRGQLLRFLNDYASCHQRDFEILSFENANYLLRDYPPSLDLLLLDIAMNGLDGIAAAGEIRKSDPSVTIIFITSMANRAIEGYKVHAYGFIKKPIDREELLYQLDSALAQIDARKSLGSYVTLQLPGGPVRLPVYDISYAEVKDHKLSVHIGADTQAFWLSLGDLEKQLSQYGFFRPHSSFLVNYRYIQRIERSRLLLTDGTELAVASKREKEVKSQYLSLLN